MSNGVSEKFDALVTSVASRHCTPADYNDRNAQVEDFANAFYTDAAARDFVALIDRLGVYAVRGLLIIEACRPPLTDDVIFVVKLVDAFTTGWLEYLRVHGHIPVDAQMFASAVLSYDVSTVIANGAN